MASQYAFAPKDDDAILRHRLLTRVSVTRGEPPMRKLVKKLSALVSELSRDGWEEEEEDEEQDGGTDQEGSGPRVSSKDDGNSKLMQECERAAKAFLLELASFEQPLLKSRAVVEANRRDQGRFQEMQQELLQQIEAAKDEIGRLKVELAEARELRRHAEECEVVRHQICQQPPRAESEAAIAALHRDIELLERENAATAHTLDLRRRQFSLLLHTIDDLQSVLDEGPDSDSRQPSMAGAGSTEVLLNDLSAPGLKGGGAGHQNPTEIASMQLD